MTEVLEQRKEHEEIAKQFKELRQTREEFEHTKRQEIEKDLVEKQCKR